MVQFLASRDGQVEQCLSSSSHTYVLFSIFNRILLGGRLQLKPGVIILQKKLNKASALFLGVHNSTEFYIAVFFT